MERKIQGRQHNREEDPPTSDACHKCKRSCRYNELGWEGGRTIRHLPVRAGEEAEARNKSKEDQAEDYVSAKGEDQVDEAEKAHGEKKKCWIARSAL